jgi:carboxylate-amine ligase
VRDLVERGNGAQRQLVVYEANHDFGEVVREVVGETCPDA